MHHKKDDNGDCPIVILLSHHSSAYEQYSRSQNEHRPEHVEQPCAHAAGARQL